MGVRMPGKKSLVCLSAVVVVIVVVSAFFVPRLSGAADGKLPPQTAKSPPTPENAHKPKPRITISKKTTYILEPLDRDGYVDYLAALNQMSSQGVTPQNNAGVLLARAIGVSELTPPEREQFYKLLGIEPLATQGEYITDFAQFVKEKLGRPATKKEEADFDRATHEPWSRRDFTLVALWLEANEKPLDLVAAATRLPRCYLPLVEPADPGLLGTRFPCLNGSRNAARLLVARAMLHLREGKSTEAEQDLLACHRLGRLCGRTPFMIPALVAVAADAIACQGDAQLMEPGRLSAERALAYQQELRKLTPLPVMADVIGKSERYMYLDTVSQVARERSTPSDAFGLLGSFLAKPIDTAFSHRSAINWDDALVFGNEQFDKAVAAARQPTAPARKKALEQLDQELRNMTLELRDPEKLAVSFVAAVARRDLGRLMGKLLTVMLVPAFEAAFESENRAHTREALGQLGFALAAYHADHGTYPDGLNALAPKYLSKVPNDLYTEQPLHYRRQGAGFLLYSVGANGVDDGGRTFDSQPQGDDIVLRIGGAVRTK